MTKRRTSGIQRRQRASTEALNRRIDAPSGGRIPWALVAILGVLAVGATVLVAFLVVGSSPNPNAGTPQSNDGQGHVPSCTADTYSSTPPTSGCHDPSPANWGVYETPQNPQQLIHNLEHGGIVIWYEADEVEPDQVAELADFVRGQVGSGQAGRFKFILSPWEGESFGHPVAVTAWTWLLYLDEVDVDAVRGFADAHYGDAPEPNGGPAP